MELLVSIEGLNWALSQTVGSPTDKFVLIMIGNWADEQGTCYPTEYKLSLYTEFTDRCVRNATARLVDKGYLRVLHRTRASARLRVGSGPGQTNNRYQLLFDGPDTPLPTHDDWVGVYAGRAKPGDGEPVDNPVDGPVDNSSPPEPGSAPPWNDVPGGGGTTFRGAPEPGSTLHTALDSDLDTNLHTGTVPDVDDLVGVALVDAARRVVEELLEGLPRRRRPTARRMAGLVDAVRALLAAGWTSPALVAELLRDGDVTNGGVASVAALLTSRLGDVGKPTRVPAQRDAQRPEWCGDPECHPQTRRRASGDLDRPADLGPCKACHPTTAAHP